MSLSQLWAIAREQIHVIVIGVQTNLILFIIRTDSHEIIYPVLIGQTHAKFYAVCTLTLFRTERSKTPEDTPVYSLQGDTLVDRVWFSSSLS